MTRHDEDLSRSARRRMIAASLLRSAAAASVMVVVYYQAPLDRPLDTATAIRFAIGLLVLAAIVTYQVRSILGSDIPRLRAIEAVAVGLPLLLLLYASSYVVITANQAGSFTEVLSRTDALYYTVTVFATVGFGDIAPKSEIARVITMTQMLVGLAAVGFVAKIVLGAVQVAVHRQTEGPALTPTPETPAQEPGSADG